MRSVSAVTSILLGAALSFGCRPAAMGASPSGAASVVVRSSLALTYAGSGSGSDWPRFRGPDNDGISREKFINKNWTAHPPQLLWKQPMTDGGYAGPSVANGMVYIIDHKASDDIIRAFDLKTGGENWSYTYPDASESNNGFARATPTVESGRLYAMSRLGKLNCLDAHSGRLIWTRDIVAQLHVKRPTWDMAGSPLIDGDRVVVYGGGPNAALVALKKQTGETVWVGGGSELAGYASPVVATIGGVKQYVCFFGKSVGGVAAADGRLLWSYPWVTSYDINAATPLVIGDKVFISSGYGHGCAMLQVSGSSARLLWTNKEMIAHFSSPIYAGGYIYGTGDPGRLMCLDPVTGAALWKQGGFEKGGIIGIDGTIIALSGSNGDLVMAVLSPDGYKELGRITPLGGQSWTAPIAAQGRLIVRNKDFLACLSLD